MSRNPEALVIIVFVVCIVALPEQMIAGGFKDNSDRYEAVLAAQPVGYWPADEGKGDVLHDLSTNENHGRIYHTGWVDGLLDFSSGFQWVEISGHAKYQSNEFAIGGWLFSRRNSYEGEGMLFIGIANPIRLSIHPSIILRIREGSEVEVLSDGKADAVGSLTDKDSIAGSQWQHLLYTYAAGTGKLYVNGQLVQSKDNVPFESRAMPLLLGCDAGWWIVPPGSRSLDGSLRDIVLFNRALTPEDVSRLVEATRPSTQPRVVDDAVLVLDDREISLESLSALSADERCWALEQLEETDVQALRQASETLAPILIKALDEWQTRRVAAGLLIELNHDDAQSALVETLPKLTQMVENQNAPCEERASSALAIAEMGALAKDAVPVLVTVLKDTLEREDVRLPRVENLLRNALIRALLDIDPRNEQARDALEWALAKPVFDSIDLKKAYLTEVRSLLEEERYMDALDVYRNLSPAQREDRFFSQGDSHRDSRGNIHERSYTAVADYNGFTYTLGEGKAYYGVEKIPQKEFEKVANQLAVEFPSAKDWRQSDLPDLYRVKITKTDANGNEETAFLEGDWFVFDGSDAKVCGWSVAVDNDGFIHVTGGQHNRPNPESYIPGSWEKIGLSRDPNSEHYPNQMYWVSRRPGDIASLEFVGRRDNPRQIPSPDYLNYMNFVQDNHGELFLYGRIDVCGFQSWGLYRYDVKAHRWIALGGHACDVIASAEESHPGWSNYLAQQVRGTIPRAPRVKSLVWAWQPHFYNYCRSTWGVQFDKSNRMHVLMQIRGLDANVRFIDSDVYAYSDDGGETFHRADGANVALPLTVNPAPNHHADIRSHSTKQWWKLWLSLLHDAGY